MLFVQPTNPSYLVASIRKNCLSVCIGASPCQSREHHGSSISLSSHATDENPHPIVATCWSRGFDANRRVRGQSLGATFFVAFTFSCRVSTRCADWRALPNIRKTIEKLKSEKKDRTTSLTMKKNNKRSKEEVMYESSFSWCVCKRPRASSYKCFGEEQQEELFPETTEMSCSSWEPIELFECEGHVHAFSFSSHVDPCCVVTLAYRLGP